MLYKLYNHVITVQLEQSLFEKAKQFAIAVAPTTNYKDSNQLKQQKIQDDHFVSKLGEEAAKKVLTAYAAVNGPDYTIYYGKSKSWSDDLYIQNEGIAVKTQKKSAANRYGLSWTFQAGLVRRDTILNRPDAWVLFVEYDDIAKNSFDVYPMFQIKELTFKPPVLEYLKGHKLVVYANTLLL